MPTPRPDEETRDEFMSRCIPMVLDHGTADDQDQAVAICSSMWEDATKMVRAYSLLEIKSFDAEQRVIEGVATTPTPDRMGDIVEPMGAKFALPMPLLWQHQHDQPVGHVTVATAGRNGISFRAKIAKIDEDGDLKRLCDNAWQAVKAKLVGGVSIGFRPLKNAVEAIGDGAVRFKEWEWLELSLVTIPANASATISLVKSLDQKQRGMSARKRIAIAPGVPGHTANPRTQGTKTMLNLEQQISQLENTRAAKTARMEALAGKAGDEGRSMDDEEADEFDELAQEMKQIDADLVRFHALEKARASAKSIDGVDDTRKASRARSGVSVQFGADLAKGTRFARYAMAIAAGKGSRSDTLQYAERWRNQTPEVIDFIKADPGVSTDGGASPTSWGGDLVYPTNIASEFVELLRPATVLGRLEGVRRVPFNIRIPVHAGGATVDWVGENAPKPVSEEAFTTITLGYAKIAGIVVLTEELVRLSSPSAEEVVRRDLVEQIAQFIDEQFLSTSVTASPGVNPASVTNGVVATPATGTEAVDLWTDMNTALAAFDSTDLGTSGMTVIMPPSVARGISSLRNLVGGAEFGVTPLGGTLMGFPVIVSTSCPASTIVLIKANEILVADDGGVRLDASNQATLNMAGVSPTEAASFNLWQRNCIGLRAERWITWAKRRAAVVKLISGAAYAPGTSP